jgi:hypothetical protein
MKPGEVTGVAEMSTLLHRYNKVGFRVAIKVLMCRVLYRLGRCCKALITIKIGVGLRRLRYG